MTPSHEAAAVVLEESLAFLREAVRDLPDTALDWRPYAGGNTVGILVRHALTSTRFFVAAGCGAPGSFEAYRQTERAAAFETKGVSQADLIGDIDAVSHWIANQLRDGTEPNLVARMSFPGSPADGQSGAAMLFRAIAHLREHVGHVQVFRDLWQARQG
jgi:hypothetical protein